MKAFDQVFEILVDVSDFASPRGKALAISFKMKLALSRNAV